MGTKHKQTKSKANAIATAWATLANAESFGGLTLAQFQQLQTNAQNKSATLATMDASYTDAMMQRDAAHDALNAAMLNVVDGGKGDTANYGANSSLYKAMGYVPRNEWGSGLTRKTTPPTSTGTTPTTTPIGGMTWNTITSTWDKIPDTWNSLGGTGTASPTATTATAPTATTGGAKT